MVLTNEEIDFLVKVLNRYVVRDRKDACRKASILNLLELARWREPKVYTDKSMHEEECENMK
jgi:hypothetical protein